MSVSTGVEERNSQKVAEKATEITDMMTKNNHTKTGSHRKVGYLLVLLLSTVFLTMHAQNKLFTLEDLNFGGRNAFRLKPQNMFLTWWGNNLMQCDAEQGLTVNKKTGKSTVVFTLDDINAQLKNDTLHSAMDATYPYADQPIVKLESSRNCVLYDFKKKKIVWQQSLQNTIQASDWNATSRALAYVNDNQLYVTDKDGKTTQLTHDGSREIVYGRSVHRDEFGISGGLFWSPDGKQLAFYRMDQSMVADYPQVNIDAREAAYEPDKYPMAGMTSHKVTVGVYDLQTGKTVYLKAGDPTDRYFTNIAWSPDSKTIYMFELNRDQNDCRLVCYNAADGDKTAELYRETDSKYVEPLHPIVFLPWDHTKFIMQSQKDGYNHLYLFNIKGEQIKQITSGKWVVMDFLGFNTKHKAIIYQSNEASPIQKNTWIVDIQTGKRALMDSGDGWHAAQISTDGQYIADKYTTPTVPRNIALTNTDNGQRTMLLQAANPWKDYVAPIFECGTLKAADGVTDLYYRMVKPADFNPKKKYPTIVYVYGGPHAHNVDASWHYGSRSWETYMAQKGYILFIIDNRGSENRGRDFEQATFRQLGQIEMKDQMKGVDYLRSLPYVDMNRLGIHGWSFGGFMTISLMTNYPDVFKVGVAGGPVIDWKWYEVMYGERYMDTPQTNPDGYAKTSLLSKAKDLKGRLQIIIGYNDATVVPQHCLSFLKACIEAGTQPDFFVYPGEPHNMRGHQSVHLHERITRYFDDYLK
jgi:dipeptidyl-peptidase-4